MLGPIPNSLGAGAYNGSFIPHGLATFAGRGGVVVIIRQKICVDAGVVETKTLVAFMSATTALDAGFVNAIPAAAGVVSDKTLAAGRVTVIALAGAIEDC